MGTYLGYKLTSNEYVLWDNDDRRVVKTRSIMRRPEEHKWNLEAIQQVNVTPHEAHHPTEPEEPWQSSARAASNE